MRKHFAVPGLQHDKHDKRKGKNDICNHKGVGDNVEDRTGLDVDGYGLVKLLSISKHTHLQGLMGWPEEKQLLVGSGPIKYHAFFVLVSNWRKMDA